MSDTRSALRGSPQAGPDERNHLFFFERGEQWNCRPQTRAASRNIKLLSALPFSFNLGSGLTIVEAHACVFYAR